jgi:hypothetical protein
MVATWPRRTATTEGAKAQTAFVVLRSCMFNFPQLGLLLEKGDTIGVLKMVTPRNVNATLADVLGCELNYVPLYTVLHYVCSKDGPPHPDDALAHEHNPFSYLVHRWGPNQVDSASLVTQLVQLGASVNACCRMGWTPLHVAAWSGKLNSIRALVACGALVDVFGDFGFTPLGIALNFTGGSTDCAVALLDASASVAHGGQCGTHLDVSSLEFQWVGLLLTGRDNARCAAVVFMGCIHRSPLLGPIHHDVVKLIGHCIWNTRLDCSWFGGSH